MRQNLIPNSTPHPAAEHLSVYARINDFAYVSSDWKYAQRYYLRKYLLGETMWASCPYATAPVKHGGVLFDLLEASIAHAVPRNEPTRDSLRQVWELNKQHGKQGTRSRTHLAAVPEPGHNVTVRRPTTHNYSPKVKGEKFTGWGNK